MKIRVVAPEMAPLSLLLTADPSPEHIGKYLQSGTVFVGAEDEGTILAVAVLEWHGTVAELKNIAVVEERQGTGLGRQMLAHVLAHAAEAGANRLEVGTGNSSFQELAFYQRNGFRIAGVVPGFFDSYQPAIVENGIACRDMVRLAINLKRAERPDPSSHPPQRPR